MQKTAIKTFLFSFSVSMLAIAVANRAFLYEKNTDIVTYDTGNKNISLFIKDVSSNKHPVKKINLTSLPSINKAPLLLDGESLQTNDIIVADNIVTDNTEVSQNYPADNYLEAAPIEKVEEQEVLLADVVYSQSPPLDNKITEKDVVYPVQLALSESEPAAPEVEEKEELHFFDLEEIHRDDVAIPLTFGNRGEGRAEVSIGNPSDLNHVALKNGDSIPIESMSNQDKEDDSVSGGAITDSSQGYTIRDNPWIIAKSKGVSKNKMLEKEFANINQEEIKQALKTSENIQGVKLASETVKNLIIPLPEKIEEKDNLLPKLAYPEDSPDAKKEKVMKVLSAKKEKQQLLTEIEDETEIPMSPPEVVEDEKNEEKKDEKKKGLFTSLSSMFSETVDKAKNEASSITSKLKSKVKKKSKKKSKFKHVKAIIPKEIRMSFQNNRAEISGQTLRWVQAFASKTAKESGTYLEVRIDRTRSVLLQQRRLNLLYNILMNKGVEYSKIRVVFTDREPNTFILKMVDAVEDEKKVTKKINKNGDMYMQW